MANTQNQGASTANEALNTREAFFLKYKKPIFAAVAAVIIVVAGILLYQSYVSGPREDKASTALAKGQDYFNAQQFEVALKGDSTGFVGFAKIVSDYSGTKAGNLANLYAGLCSANLNKWEDAVKYLEDFSTASDAMVSPAAKAALGNAYAQTGNIDKAISTLKKAADMADAKGVDGVNTSLSPTFLLQAAQLLESQNKKEEARSLYETIKKKYINSALVQSTDIDKYIQRVSE